MEKSREAIDARHIRYRLCEVLVRLRRKVGNSGIAEDLRLARMGLDEQVYSDPFQGKNDAGDVGYHREDQDV